MLDADDDAAGRELEELDAMGSVFNNNGGVAKMGGSALGVDVCVADDVVGSGESVGPLGPASCAKVNEWETSRGRRGDVTPPPAKPLKIGSPRSIDASSSSIDMSRIVLIFNSSTFSSCGGGMYVACAEMPGIEDCVDSDADAGYNRSRGDGPGIRVVGAAAVAAGVSSMGLFSAVSPSGAASLRTAFSISSSSASSSAAAAAASA